MSALEQLPTLGEGVVPSRLGLELPEGLTFGEWCKLGDSLLRMHDSSLWWLGAWRAYGQRYEADYGLAVARLDSKYEQLRLVAKVDDGVAAADRVVGLSWQHHRAVLAAPAADRPGWLDAAERNGWTPRELEQQIVSLVPVDPRPLVLTVKAVGELRDLCVQAAEHAGVTPGEWASAVLERAAREELGGGTAKLVA